MPRCFTPHFVVVPHVTKLCVNGIRTSKGFCSLVSSKCSRSGSGPLSSSSVSSRQSCAEGGSKLPAAVSSGAASAGDGTSSCIPASLAASLVRLLTPMLRFRLRLDLNAIGDCAVPPHAAVHENGSGYSTVRQDITQIANRLKSRDQERIGQGAGWWAK